MHHIGVVGVSWRHGPADTLASLTIPRDERPDRLLRIAEMAQVNELVYLATCNRVEVVFATDDSTPIAVCRRRIFAALTGREPRVGEAEHTFRVWQGEGAAEHLFLVAAGLDSARLGESEIAVQVREATELSRSLGLLSPRLDRVLSEALKVAKRVRPVTDAHAGRISLADIALRHVVERLSRTPGRVALIGVSPMTEQCARELAARGVGVVIANRTVARATALAAEVGGEGVALDAFRAHPAAVEAMIVATGSRDPVLDRADLERIAAHTTSGESPLVVDLSIPPGVAPEDAAAADVPRVGMHQISAEATHDREQLLVEFADARAMVDDALTALRREQAERLVGPMIAQLRLRYRRTALDGVERLFERDLAGIGEPEREAIRRWAETLARRFAHVPSVGLRDLAFQVGPSAVEAFFGAAEPQLVRALREAVDRSGAYPLERGFEEA